MLKIKQQKDNLELVVNKRAIKIIMLLHYTINEQYKLRKHGCCHPDITLSSMK